jgi:phosphopantothenoylcysteine decarboxylase/phosphopantothenate--cysteine ligase
MATVSPGALAGKRIVLAVTGSIAAYKSVLLARQLTRAGAEVRVILSEAARHFIGEATFTGLGLRVEGSMWGSPGESHVTLASWADCVLVAPATADTLARLAAGRADDLLSATVLCSRRALCVAPAMHPAMWAAAATQQNAATLFARGAHFIGPVEGEVASGEVGLGRMAEPEQILLGLVRAVHGPGRLGGRHVVVTAGPTREALDPVRALTNLSSGRMGYAVAAALVARGADVTLISGPVALPPPDGVRLMPVESALDMQGALDAALGPQLDGADALIMAAAVADYRPLSQATHKLKRGSEPLVLQLTPNPDLLADIGKRRTTARPVLVGFALESAEGDALVGLGRRKLIEKRVDMVVANSTSGLSGDENQVQLVTPVDCTRLERMSKAKVAGHIVDWLTARLDAPAKGEFTE